MTDSLNDLHARYLRAIHVFNEEMEEHIPMEFYTVFRLRELSQDEFADWWACVREDSDLERRWTERFNDPEGSLASEREEIIAEFDQIPLRRKAA